MYSGVISVVAWRGKDHLGKIFCIVWLGIQDS